MQRDPKKRNAPAATRASQIRLIGEQVVHKNTLRSLEVNPRIQEAFERLAARADELRAAQHAKLQEIADRASNIILFPKRVGGVS